MGCNVGRASGALVRIGEAHLENVSVCACLSLAVRIDNGRAGSGRSDGKDLIFLIKRSNCSAGGGGDRREGDLHLAVHQGTECCRCLFSIVLVIFKLKLELYTALGVDFLNSHLGCCLYSVAVNCCGTCQRTGAADLDGSGGSFRFGIRRCAAGTAAAAGCQGSCHECRHGNCQSGFPELFHNMLPPV